MSGVERMKCLDMCVLEEEESFPFGGGKGIIAGRQFSSLSYAKLDQARKGKPGSREWKQASKREGIAMPLFLFYLFGT